MTITPVFGTEGFQYIASIMLNGDPILAYGASKKEAFCACIAAMAAVMKKSGVVVL